MSIDVDRHARLYYDPSCGSCRFLAGTVGELSRGRVETVPLTAGAAASDLGDLRDDERSRTAHVVEGTERRSGPDIVVPLVGLTFGPGVGRLFAQHPTLARPLRWGYGRLWEYRQHRGCAAKTG